MRTRLRSPCYFFYDDSLPGILPQPSVYTTWGMRTELSHHGPPSIVSSPSAACARSNPSAQGMYSRPPLSTKKGEAQHLSHRRGRSLFPRPGIQPGLQTPGERGGPATLIHEIAFLGCCVRSHGRCGVATVLLVLSFLVVSVSFSPPSLVSPALPSFPSFLRIGEGAR